MEPALKFGSRYVTLAKLRKKKPLSRGKYLPKEAQPNQTHHSNAEVVIELALGLGAVETRPTAATEKFVDRGIDEFTTRTDLIICKFSKEEKRVENVLNTRYSISEGENDLIEKI
jgi:hypothetical protein